MRGRNICRRRPVGGDNVIEGNKQDGEQRIAHQKAASYARIHTIARRDQIAYYEQGGQQKGIGNDAHVSGSTTYCTRLNQ